MIFRVVRITAIFRMPSPWNSRILVRVKYSEKKAFTNKMQNRKIANLRTKSARKRSPFSNQLPLLVGRGVHGARPRGHPSPQPELREPRVPAAGPRGAVISTDGGSASLFAGVVLPRLASRASLFALPAMKARRLEHCSHQELMHFVSARVAVFKRSRWRLAFFEDSQT